MKIIVSGGRTGGHLIPGIAIYEELCRKGADCTYIMSDFDLRFSVTARVREEDRLFISLSRMDRKLSLKTPLYMLKILRAFFQVFLKIRAINPAAVIITGGYISNPVALSAVLLGKPLYIAEQNSAAGVTNRFYAFFARRVFTALPSVLHIPQRKAVLTGNPSLFNQVMEKAAARAVFELPVTSQVLGIVGGSQGARKINDKAVAVIRKLAGRDTAVIWSVGAVEYERMEKDGILKTLLDECPLLRVFAFISRMDAFYSLCDAVITRAGATSLAEILYYQVPAVFIPIFNSPDNHQYLNARFVTDGGGGMLIEEPGLSPENLYASVDTLLNNYGHYRKALSELKKSLGQEIPQEKITELIFSDLECR